MKSLFNQLKEQQQRSLQFTQRVAELQRAPAPRSRVKGLGGDILFNKR